LAGCLRVHSLPWRGVCGVDTGLKCTSFAGMNTPHVSRTIRASYALPALPLAAMYFPVFVFLSEFYAGVHGLNLATLGFVLLAIRIFDAVSDPVVGHLSDGSGWLGRRKLWLVAATPVVMFATWQLFVPPDGVGVAWFAGWLFLLTFGWTLAMTAGCCDMLVEGSGCGELWAEDARTLGCSFDPTQPSGVPAFDRGLFHQRFGKRDCGDVVCFFRLL